jgi:hypothetical protein
MIKENIEILEYIYPFYKSINERILKESLTFDYVHGNDLKMVDGGKSNVKAFQTTYTTVRTDSTDKIYNWILTLLSQHYKGWSYGVQTSWISNYREGDYTESHDHVPSSFSFNYFVKTPKGSSPLVFTTSRKKIKAEEGKVVIFPGCCVHEVPKNKCNDRIVLSGNIYPVLS